MIVIGTAVFLAWRLRIDLIHTLDNALQNRARQTALALEDPREPQTLDLEEVTSGRFPGLPRADGITQVVKPSGRVIKTAGADDDVRLISNGTAGRLRSEVSGTVRVGPTEYRTFALKLPNSRDILVVSTMMQPVREANRRLLLLLSIAIPFSIALSGGAGYVLARRALRPIDRMTQTAADIGAHDTETRLDVPNIQDEVGRLGRTLNGMLDRLHEAIAEQRRFTSDASHELRTPLSIMQSEVDVALRSSRTPAAARPALESISDELARMRRIVENLLTLARMDEGRLELASSHVDVVEIVKSAESRLEGPAHAKGVDVTIDAPERELMWGDRTWLEQLVTNLLDNAIKYTGSGGSVRVAINGKGNDLELVVSDTGVGIPHEAMAHVFDRFYRVDKARTRAAGGTGLGLAICRSIVDAHHGEIEVKSETGRGSVFTVRLPRRA